MTEKLRQLLVDIDRICQARLEGGPFVEAHAKSWAEVAGLAQQGFLREVPALAEVVGDLEDRRDALLAVMVRLTRETPYAEEIDEYLAQRGKLVAEIGTLRARVARLEEALGTANRLLHALGVELPAADTALAKEAT